VIDWQRIFEQYGVDHIQGPAPNVRRGRIGINCPRCPNDTKHHFSVDIETGRVIGCWRDSTHWMPPAQLLSTVTGMSLPQALQLVGGKQQEMADGSTPAALLRQLEQSDAKPERTKMEALALPQEFQPFQKLYGAEAKFRRYLEDRGFIKPLDTAKTFDLRWWSTGDFAGRIIFPIRRWVGAQWKERIVAWTGRAIGYSRARYKTHPPGSATESLLWESRPILKGDALVVVEGPFDALKAAVASDVTAVALLTNRAGPGKIGRIVELAKLARRTIVLLDRGAEAQALDLQRDLAVIKPVVAFVPEPWKDPGDMPVRDLSRFLAKHV